MITHRNKNVLLSKNIEKSLPKDRTLWYTCLMLKKVVCFAIQTYCLLFITLSTNLCAGVGSREKVGMDYSPVRTGSLSQYSGGGSGKTMWNMWVAATTWTGPNVLITIFVNRFSVFWTRILSPLWWTNQLFRATTGELSNHRCVLILPWLEVRQWLDQSVHQEKNPQIHPGRRLEEVVTVNVCFSCVLIPKDCVVDH